MINESFSDTTPIELSTETGDNTVNTENDSFDNTDVILPENMKNEEIPKNNQTQQLGEKEEKLGEDSKIDNKKDQDDENEQKPSEDKKEGDDEKAESKDGDKPDELQQPRGKSVRLKDGDKSVDVSEDSTLKVKVKGKNEFVSISELKRDYSGRVAYDEKFKGLEEKNSQIEEKSQKIEKERNGLIEHMTHIGGLLDKVMSGNGDPMSALNYLVDLSGRNVLEFNKKVMDGLAREALELSEMDEIEQRLYWRDREVESIRSNQAAKEAKLKEEETQRELSSKVDNLRKTQGVTEDQYVQAHKELKDLKIDDSKITPEAIVNYAVMKPHYESADNVCSQFEDDLGDNDMDKLISTVANTLRNYPKVDEEKALEISLNLLGWDYTTEDDDIKAVNDKIVNEPAHHVQSNSASGHKVESFDDYNDQYYG